MVRAGQIRESPRTWSPSGCLYVMHLLRAFLRSLADTDNPASRANVFRRQRFLLFRTMIDAYPRPLRILDIGGTAEFWQMMDFENEPDCTIVLLNTFEQQVTLPIFRSTVGDGRNLRQYVDKEFDLVFSNSVIEHVGRWEDQCAMAREVQRVGRSFFVQTPNFYFPLEPHYLFPFFQFLPRAVKTILLRLFSLGWATRSPSLAAAWGEANAIRLLSRRELAELFPTGTITAERFWFLTKSFVVTGGTDRVSPRQSPQIREIAPSPESRGKRWLNLGRVKNTTNAEVFSGGAPHGLRRGRCARKATKE